MLNCGCEWFGNSWKWSGNVGDWFSCLSIVFVFWCIKYFLNCGRNFYYGDIMWSNVLICFC